MRVWMFFPLLAACNPDADKGETGDSGETDDSGDSGETGDSGDSADTGDSPDTADSGDTGLPDTPAVIYEYPPPGDESGFGFTCSTVTVDGTPGVSVDSDGDGVIDCGRGHNANITLEAYYEDALEESHALTAAELTGAAQLVWSKAVPHKQAAHLTVQATCDMVCDAMFQAPRKGNCPEFKGSAVFVSCNALTTAMNSVEDRLEASLTITLTGEWAWVSTRPGDLLAPKPKGSTHQSPVNIWWAAIYGLRNYGAGSLIYGDENQPVAMYSLSYAVPGKIVPYYEAFLANDLTNDYPDNSTFSLKPLTAKYSTNGVVSTNGAWPTWWQGPVGTGVIDPVFGGDPQAVARALDEFILHQVLANPKVVPATFAPPEVSCPTSTGFEPYDPSEWKHEGGPNGEHIQLYPECPEAP